MSRENTLRSYMRRKATLESVMNVYDISTNGFIPETNEANLPENYAEWEDVCRQLPELIHNKTLDSVIESLPLISVEELVTPAQKKRAYLIFCMIGNGYLWKNGKEDVPKCLPENIAYPWFRVAKALGLKPILTHAAVDLYNCVWDPNMKNADPDQMDCLYTITGTRDEKWFFLIMSAIELEGSKGIHISLRLLKAFHDKNNEAIIKELADLSENIHHVELLLRRTLEKDDTGEYKCHPDVFWNQLRIYLGGTADPTVFPDGLEFESIEGGFERNNGGSAAQSSLIQLYDAVLGVAHVSIHTRKFLLLMRYYMPEKHRFFLEDMENVSEIRDYVMMTNDTDMTEAFNKCIENLTQFRKYHYYIVQRYIIDKLPAEAAKHAKGSGGTTLNGFLVISEKETHNSELVE